MRSGSSSMDLHVDHKAATLTVVYITQAPDLTEINEQFKIVPKDSHDDYIAVADAPPDRAT